MIRRFDASHKDSLAFCCTFFPLRQRLDPATVFVRSVVT
jgi:hypothetical protein